MNFVQNKWPKFWSPKNLPPTSPHEKLAHWKYGGCPTFDNTAVTSWIHMLKQDMISSGFFQHQGGVAMIPFERKDSISSTMYEWLIGGLDWRFRILGRLLTNPIPFISGIAQNPNHKAPNHPLTIAWNKLIQKNISENVWEVSLNATVVAWKCVPSFKRNS